MLSEGTGTCREEKNERSQATFQHDPRGENQLRDGSGWACEVGHTLAAAKRSSATFAAVLK